MIVVALAKCAENKTPETARAANSIAPVIGNVFVRFRLGSVMVCSVVTTFVSSGKERARVFVRSVYKSLEGNTTN